MNEDSIRERVAQWLDEVIEGMPFVAEYERDPDSDPTQFPAASMTDNGHGDPDDGDGGITHYDMDVDVEIFVKGSEGRSVSTELNNYHASLVKAVMRPGEPPIGGLAEEIHEGALRRFTAMLAAEPRRGFRQKFTIRFPTKRGDPAQQ
ncbi:hypothetical protein O4H52_03090 [Sphingomonadaceae bacterium G21617-S1]|nr:hypothetical protein [Sphingomonadaceae bacterium G21617-S1]